MSSTNRGAVREPGDFYPTPSWCVDRLLDALDLPGGLWLEPAAGKGAIIDAVSARRRDVRWSLVELNPEPADIRRWRRSGIASESTVRGSFFDVRVPPLRKRPKVIITNPPFKPAMKFIDHALSFEPEFVVMLLRLNFLASASRAEFMQQRAPDLYILPDRPSFTGGKSDSIDYAWFVWPRGARRRVGSVQVLELTPLLVRKPPEAAVGSRPRR